jgi:hypothetical protein
MGYVRESMATSCHMPMSFDKLYQFKVQTYMGEKRDETFSTKLAERFSL